MGWDGWIWNFRVSPFSLFFSLSSFPSLCLCVSSLCFFVSRAFRSLVPSGYREGVACFIKAMEIQCEKKNSNYFFFQKLLITLPSLSFLSLDIMIYDI